MEGESILTTTAEVGIAIAGFSGIAAALSGRQEPWSDSDRVRFQMLLRTSMSAVFFSLIPLVLELAKLSGSTLWRASSALWLVYITVSVAAVSPTMARSAQTDSEPLSRVALTVFLGTLVAQITMQAVNAAWLASAWPFVTTVVLSLLLATMYFIRLLRGFLGPSSHT